MPQCTAYVHMCVLGKWMYSYDKWLLKMSQPYQKNKQTTSLFTVVTHLVWRAQLLKPVCWHLLWVLRWAALVVFDLCWGPVWLLVEQRRPAESPALAAVRTGMEASRATWIRTAHKKKKRKRSHHIKKIMSFLRENAWIRDQFLKMHCALAVCTLAYQDVHRDSVFRIEFRTRMEPVRSSISQK